MTKKPVLAFASGQKTADGYHPLDCILYKETVMVGMITGSTADFSDARCLLQDPFTAEADILKLPDPENGQLNIRVYGASRPARI